eukprot:TRINITY_DN15302_c0_g1_i1.p1 TRINITY_DN15302_c0_g1~~TRINITY_DN15302_c0_g1_i1.p1  ORF type:complete len:175 (-),score=39.70 TRINITY_DN15302_c0_g1_i1:59-583(-)
MKMSWVTTEILLVLLVFSPCCLCDIVFGGNAGNNRKVSSGSSSFTCGCKCSNLGFRGADGALQGNCLSSDSGAGAWCYVDPACIDQCGDLQSSNRFPDFSWSYQACQQSAQGRIGKDDKSQFRTKKENIQGIKFSGSGSRIGRLPSAAANSGGTQFTSEKGLVGKLADIINSAR